MPDNLETPLILIPLDTSFSENDTSKANAIASPAGKVSQLDRYGYPLNAAYFNATNKGTLEYNQPISISEDFTLCFQVKQETLAENVLFQLMNGEAGEVNVSIHIDGEISIK